MSRVFVATETRLGRRVVVKVLRTEIAAGSSLARFEREMSLCARCHHPHIVPVLATGEVDGLPWFTMPLVEGESLRERLAQSGPLPIGEAIRLLSELADALDYAHRMSVIHRDLKPENILLQDGHAVLADFGVAKALYAASSEESALQVTDVGTVIGTPAYMAPEQAVGDLVDHRVDLYALGVVAYEMLTGDLPFTGMTPSQMVSAQLTRAPAPVTQARRDCPPALATLIERLLARDPAERPGGAEEVRAELVSLSSGVAPGAPRRSRGVLAAAIIGIAAAVALGVVLTSRRPTRSAPASTELRVKSLAVLPCRNIGGDSTTDYFSDGMADELITALGRLAGLRVASRASAFAARGRSDDLREIGRRLEVGAILECTVQQSGSRIRATARLVDAAGEVQLWDGEYRSEVRDVFAVQDTIARAIATALRLTLTGVAGTPLVEHGTQDTAAHDMILRGRYFLGLRTPAALLKAREAFESGVQRDPAYAAGWAGLADAYGLGIPYGVYSPDSALTRARTAALRALSLDSTLAEAHAALGFVVMFGDRNLEEAERRLDRAVELNPSHVQGRLLRAYVWMLKGGKEQALGEMEQARTLDPLSLIIRTRIGTMLHFVGRDVEAIGAFQRALEIDSTFAQARAGLALSYAMTGKLQDALRLRPHGEPLKGTYEAGQWGFVLARAGRPEEARRELATLQAQRKTRYVAADALAVIYSGLGQADSAFAELDRAVAGRSISQMITTVEPMFASLHRDPRWSRYLARLTVRELSRQ
jgi:serine/threonine-protein kinase